MLYWKFVYSVLVSKYYWMQFVVYGVFNINHFTGYSNCSTLFINIRTGIFNFHYVSPNMCTYNERKYYIFQFGWATGVQIDLHRHLFSRHKEVFQSNYYLYKDMLVFFCWHKQEQEMYSLPYSKTWIWFCSSTVVNFLWCKICFYCYFIMLHGSPSIVRSCDSSVSIALSYGLDDWGSRFRFPAGAGKFYPHHRVQNGSGAHPASYSVGTGGSFHVVKRPGREADHSPPSSAEVKNVWSYISTPQYVLMAWCLVKHKDNSTFTFILWWCIQKFPDWPPGGRTANGTALGL
jgi:hypothetical protein